MLISRIALVAVFLGLVATSPVVAQRGQLTVWAITTAGTHLEGTTSTSSFEILVDGKARRLRLADVLSVHTAVPSTPSEMQRIAADIVALAGKEVRPREAASEDLTNLGIAALSPVLAALKDPDALRPSTLYRVFSRLLPAEADSIDRTQDLVRLANGQLVRGKLIAVDIAIQTLGGEVIVSSAELRRLAVRRSKVARDVEVHGLRHCTQIEWMDTGVGLTTETHVEQYAQGYVRLDFNEDGWSSDADGIKKPGPNYNTHLVDGFPFGALVGRVGAGGARWFAGRHFAKGRVGEGRLYLAVNDNPHWQNNLGAFRVRLTATNAYDLGEAQ